jgi:putative methionine-R-sulfoxide reductase with GAF domain
VSAVDAVRNIVERGVEADDILRDVVEALVSTDEIRWAGIAFSEDEALHLGPALGEPDEALRERVPVEYDGAVVGELWADGAVHRDELGRIASLIAPYVLIGWDTGGEAWEP